MMNTISNTVETDKSSRRGKIARLPQAVRGELNERLANNQSAGTILSWLNDLPEVRTMLQKEFAGRAINPQNLANWRQGGHWEWLLQPTFRLAEAIGDRFRLGLSPA